MRSSGLDSPVRVEFLLPGAVRVVEAPGVITTILGSCVAATMYCRRLRLGGMCHALLPQEPNGVESAAGRFRYVDRAIPGLFGMMVDRGVRPREMETKLFGGAGVVAGRTGHDPGSGIGQENIRAALEVLARLGVTLAASHLGGGRGQKIQLHTATGEVFLQLLRQTAGRESRDRRE